VRFFDAETGQARGQTVLAGTGWLLSLDFSPGGGTLVAAGADGAVRLVDVEEGTQIGPPLVGLPAPPAVAAFSPVEERLFAVGRNGSGIRWDLSLERLEEHACRVAGRSLTRAEWELFLPSRPYAPACA
jgi:WD40 repeat protein